jgi:hypothetical protein
MKINNYELPSKVTLKVIEIYEPKKSMLIKILKSDNHKDIFKGEKYEVETLLCLKEKYQI